MPTKAKYQIKRDGFNDGVERAFDDVIELTDAAAAPLVALGAVVETDLPLTAVVAPTADALALLQAQADADALTQAKRDAVKSPPAKAPAKKK